MADDEKNKIKLQTDIQQPVNIEIEKRMKALRETAPYVTELPPGYLEALSRMAEYGSVSNGTNIASGEMAKAFSEYAKTISQVDFKALADEYAMCLHKAMDDKNGSKKKKISAGQKKFQDLITISKPNSIEELVKCLKQKKELQEVWEECINSDSSKVTYFSMTLDESYMEKIRDSLFQLEEYCVIYQTNFPEYNLKRLEKNIDYLIKQHNMSRYDLELALDVAPSYLSRVFNPTDEKRRISVDVLWKICNYFGISMDSILKEDLQSNTIAIDNKTIEFMETILKATQERKIKWETYRESRYITSDARDAVADLLFDRELTEEDEHIETKVWMNLGEKKTIYFASVACKNDTYYYFGTDGNDSFKWMINTKEKKQQTIKPLCKQLNKLIIDFESAGYVSAEEESLMDQIMEGLK